MRSRPHAVGDVARTVSGHSGLRFDDGTHSKRVDGLKDVVPYRLIGDGLLCILTGSGWQFGGDFGNFAPNFLNLLSSSLRDHVPRHGLGGEQR